MGLNIGIIVKNERDEYMFRKDREDNNVRAKKIESKFVAFLDSKFPRGGFGPSTVGYFSMYNEFHLDVRMHAYGKKFKEKHPNTDMYLAIIEFIFEEFYDIDGIKMQTYWSG